MSYLQTFKKLEDALPDLLEGLRWQASAHRPYGIFSRPTAREIRILAEPTEALFSEVASRLTARWGEPCLVHPFYGPVRRAEDLFVTWNFCPVNYDSEAPSLFFFKKLPRGRSISYAEYRGVDEAVRRAFARLGVRIDGLPHYTDEGFLYISPLGHQIVALRGNRLSVFGSGPEGGRSQATVDPKRPETVSAALDRLL